jgi:tRNA-specific 2-thiouridylase
MRLWSDPECAVSDSPSCCSPQAIRDAREVCHSLGLAHLTVDYTEAFAESVVDSFVDGYLAGLTPNPCTFCNGSFRFPALLSLADRLGIATVATGHYARIVDADDREFIARAADEAKDQSYMLWGINQSVLARLEFPLGDIRKDETRLIARESGLKVHDRPESQEVCFIPDNDYRRFVRSRAIGSGKGKLLPGEGDILDDEGSRLGSHQGFIDFTVGQRHGLGVSASEPLYVLRTFPEMNQVVAGKRHQLEVRHLTIRGINSFLEPGCMAADNLSVQVRYNSQPVTVIKMEIRDDRWLISLAEPAFGVAPGQSAVLYDEGMLLAGGIIEATA